MDHMELQKLGPEPSNLMYYHSSQNTSLQRLNNVGIMHGARRVTVFCLLAIILPSTLIILPLYLRHSVFADVVFAVAESDVLTIKDGLSSVFCEKHTLKMNTTFNAFQLRGTPEISHNRKHIRLKKSMSLPDDTLEYWGFYLLRGATVKLKVCSRYDGSTILVVHGERNLRTCGLLEHNRNKSDVALARGQGKVTVTFETAAELVEPKYDNEEESENHAKEDFSDDSSEEITHLSNIAESYIKKHTRKDRTEDPNGQFNSSIVKRHKRRHARNSKLSNKINKIYKRDVHVLDRGINHGGNAGSVLKNNTASVSSFEEGLLNCYAGDILLAQGFPPSSLCKNVKFLENGKHMITKHEVAEDGYFYYIFYSDNDFVLNDIHAVFDIYKPTYQYSNISSEECINSTECTFAIDFWSDETVIVEVPTRDGIEDEEDDITLLVSTCHPRMTVYVIFPISVLLFILVCAFL